MTATPRKSLNALAAELDEAATLYRGKRMTHVKSKDRYAITGVNFRESDMAIEVRYSPLGMFFTQVEFARTVDQMEFGKRFVIDSDEPEVMPEIEPVGAVEA